MLIATLSQFIREHARKRAEWLFRADRAAIPVNEIERAGIMCGLRGSFTLPFVR